MRPLDRYVFGTLKSIYHRMYRKDIDNGLFKRVGKRDFAAFLITAWDQCA